MKKNETQPATYKPFALHHLQAEWCHRNCGTCKKGFDRLPTRFRCDWERALCVSAVDDGKVTKEVAKAIGYLDNIGCSIWECPAWARR